MKCLTKYQIQGLIDNELNPAEKIAAEQHLAVCPPCRNFFEEQKQFSAVFKKEMRTAIEMPAEIPAFRVPENRASVANSRKKQFPLWLKAAAVLLPAVLIWKFSDVVCQSYPERQPQAYTPTAQDIMMYETYDDMDANTAFQQKTIIVSINDMEGNVKYMVN
jgi:predicted anti-sigma-YlaC factor YlaD